MVRLGATASNSHMSLCRELETVFHRNGIDFDWVLYSGYDAMVDAFVRKEIDIAHSQVALDTFNDVYGTAGTRLDTCNTCHSTGRSTNWYGSHQKSEFSRMMNPRAENLTEEQSLNAFRAVLRGIEELDSDIDGYSNIAEIRARTFPGDPGDHPGTDQ